MFRVVFSVVVPDFLEHFINPPVAQSPLLCLSCEGLLYATRVQHSLKGTSHIARILVCTHQMSQYL